MMTNTGITDLVPLELRRLWSLQGFYPNKSAFQLFAEHAVQQPDKLAVVTPDEEINYRTLYETTLCLASGFKNLGIVNGDVIAYQLPNSWHSCAIDLAAAALGAIVVPFPPGRGTLDIESMLRRSHARAFIYSSESDPTIQESLDLIKPKLQSLRFLIPFSNSSQLHSTSEQSATKPSTSLTDLLCSQKIEPESLAPVDPNAPLRFLVSSGTESEPKLIAYSHNALLGGRGRFLERLHSGKNAQDFRGLYLVPLGSAFGSTATFGVLSYLGGSLALLPKFNSQKTVHAIEQLQPTHILGVPTMFQRILSEPNLKTINKSSLQAIVSGGAISDEETIKRCKDAFDCHFINLYGSADGVNCHNMPEDHPDTMLYSVGKPYPSICEFRITGDDGKSLPAGEVGEIQTRGPISPMQYVNAPELDEQYRDKEGWVRTGDLGLIDSQGYLVLSGRKKDIIIRGGVNISPVQIEKLATAHPAILGAACVALPDTELGQRVCICIMKRGDAHPPSLSDMCTYLLKKGLSKNKLPEYLRVYKHFPLTPAGKIDKSKLAEDFKVLAMMDSI